MLRKCLNGAKNILYWTTSGATIGAITGLTIESTGYGIMKSWKSCDAMLEYAKTIGCGYRKATGDEFGDRCGKVYYCNSTTVDRIHDYDTAVSIHYQPYAFWGSVVGATLGGVAGLCVGIGFASSQANPTRTVTATQIGGVATADITPPPIENKPISKTLSCAVQSSACIGASAIFAGLSYAHYVLANTTEGHDTNSYNSTSLTFALVMPLITMVIGPAVSVPLGMLSGAMCGLFSSPKANSTPNTQLSSIAIEHKATPAQAP